MKDARGYSVVEVIISSAVLVVAILGVHYQYTKQMQSESALNLQMQGRLVMSSVLSRIVGNPEEFPVLTAPAGPLTYVLCYEEKGTPRTNSVSGTTEPLLASIPAANLQFPGNGLCGPADAPFSGGMEVHITPLAAGSQRQVQVDVIILPKGTLASDQRHFKISVNTFRQVVTL